MSTRSEFMWSKHVGIVGFFCVKFNVDLWPERHTQNSKRRNNFMLQIIHVCVPYYTYQNILNAVSLVHAWNHIGMFSNNNRKNTNIHLVGFSTSHPIVMTIIA